MKKIKFLLLQTQKNRKVKKLLNTQNTKIKIGYKFDLEFINSKMEENFISNLKNKLFLLI